MNDLSRIIIALLQLKGVGRQKVKRLMELVGDPLSLSFRELVEFGQTFHLIASQINQNAIDSAMDYANTLIHGCERLGIAMISFWDQDFPACLCFNDHPILLFYQGNFSVLNQPKRAAVVGSRNPTPFGADFAFQSGKMLAENDFVVISGLATGADTAGHRGCLNAGGKTVAFLPSGLSPVYPSVNRSLAEAILSHDGCLISEYHHLETTVQPYQFIERDRLQSGSSLFVIVSSFSPGSGTIHTLGFANKYRRPVFSIPIIYEESQDGFAALKKQKISFEILDNPDLKQVIENY